MPASSIRPVSCHMRTLASFTWTCLEPQELFADHHLLFYSLPLRSIDLNTLRISFCSISILLCVSTSLLTDASYVYSTLPNQSYQTSDGAVPVPVVTIDQDSDRDATIVQLSFGDRLGALLDTVIINVSVFLDALTFIFVAAHSDT
jgi:hypothetical protein